MIDYNTPLSSMQSMVPIQANQYICGMNSPPLWPPSCPQAWIPQYGMSILDKRYEEMLEKTTRIAFEKERCKESAEYLDTDAYYKDIRLFSTDDLGRKIRGRPFMNASFIDAVGYISKDGGLGAVITLQLTTTGEQHVVVVKPEELGSVKLVDIIEGPGLIIAAKISKERKRDLLSSFIKRLLKRDSIITPRNTVQWCREGNRLFYVDGLKSTLIDADSIKARVIWNTDNWSNYGDKLETLVRMMTIFKEPSYAALVIMSCAGGFLKSILLPLGWKPEAALCFCGNGVNVMSVLECFVSFWENMAPKIVKADQNEKKFRTAVIDTGDELMLVDCGHELIASSYLENQRKSNIQFTAKWGEGGYECFPIFISNDLYDICRMEDYMIPIIIEDSSIQWEVWKDYSTQKAGLAELILLLKNYIEASSESIQKRVIDIMTQRYAAAHNEQSKYPGVKAVYQTIKEILLSMIQYHAIKNQWSDLFLAACEQAIDLIELYADIPTEEFIEERFLACMDLLVDSRTFIFADMKANLNSYVGRPVIFCKDDYLYMEIIDFKEIVLKEMGISDKNITKVLSVLKDADYVCTYRRAKDFYVDVTIGSSHKRKSMIRFDRRKFQKTGEADIMMRGEYVSEE